MQIKEQVYTYLIQPPLLVFEAGSGYLGGGDEGLYGCS